MNSTRVTGLRKLLAAGLGIVFILLIWQIAAWSLPGFLMPGVPTVLAALIDQLVLERLKHRLLRYQYV